MLGWAGALAALATPALAAPTDVRSFDIAGKPLPEALVEFAVKAGVTLGGAQTCAAQAPPLKGRYSLTDALTRLLAGSGCGFAWLDAETVQIAPKAAPRPRPVAIRPVQPPAAPAIDPGPDLASELVVTATKRPELRDRLPYAISAVGGRAIQAFGADGASDVGVQMAGVTVTNLGPGRDKILLRGLSDGVFTGRTQSTVGLYVDNVPITYSAPDPDLRLADIDKVEVLRGPQGSLYGSGSIGGIYRIIPRRPDLDRYSGYLTLSAEATRSGAPGGAFEGMVNLPLASGRIGLRAVGYREEDGGYIDDVGQGKDNVNRTVRAGARVALLTEPAPGWTVELGGVLQWINSDDTQYATLPNNPYARANRVAEPHDNDFYQAHLTVTGDTRWGVLTSSTAFVRHAVDSRYDASTALPMFGVTDGAPGPFDDGIEINLITQEMNLASRGDGPLRWLVGGFASISDEATLDLLQAPDLIYSENRKDRLQELAAFSEVSYRFTPKLTATVGLRFFDTVVRTSSVVTMPRIAGQRLFVGADRSSGWAPKLALQYQLGPRSLVYALASEGYRAGGFNTAGVIGQLFSAPRLPEPTRKFTPDELWNYEIGLKTNLFDGRLQLRASAFFDIWKDLQTDQFLPSGLSYTANVGEGRNKGIEGELAYLPTDRWTLELNALIEGPELSRVNPGSQAAVDVGLPGVPDALVGAGATYRRPVWNGVDLTLGAQLQYVGHSQLTFDSNLGARMGGYISAKLAASVENARWRLAVVLSNPTNSSGDTFAFGNPFTLRTMRQTTPLRPTTLRVDLTAKF